MFYDKQSNNQVLRMQTIYTGVPVKDEAAELRSVLDCSAYLTINNSFQAVYWYRVCARPRAASNVLYHTKA